MIVFGSLVSKAVSVALAGRRASATMRKLEKPSVVWVPRTRLWTEREGFAWGRGDEGDQWTVREGHSRG